MSDKKTKVGKFLQTLGDAGKNVLTSIASGKDPVSAIISAVTGGAMSTEDAELAFKYHQEDLKDTKNARDNKTAITTSKEAPLMSKLIHEIIAIAVIGAWIVSWFVPILVPSIQITGAVMLILGFLYGKSQPNKE
jgi:hypothetical protein